MELWGIAYDSSRKEDKVLLMIVNVLPSVR